MFGLNTVLFNIFYSVQGLNLVKSNISASDSYVEESLAATEIAFLFLLFNDLSTAIEKQTKKKKRKERNPWNSYYNSEADKSAAHSEVSRRFWMYCGLFFQSHRHLCGVAFIVPYIWTVLMMHRWRKKSLDESFTIPAKSSWNDSGPASVRRLELWARVQQSGETESRAGPRKSK